MRNGRAISARSIINWRNTCIGSEFYMGEIQEGKRNPNYEGIAQGNPGGGSEA